MSKVSFANLKRPKHKMMDFVKSALEKNKVMNLYKSRPAYQQNDYLRWIAMRKREETQMKRVNIMINDLKKGNLYMGMKMNS